MTRVTLIAEQKPIQEENYPLFSIKGSIQMSPRQVVAKRNVPLAWAL